MVVDDQNWTMMLTKYAATGIIDLSPLSSNCYGT